MNKKNNKLPKFLYFYFWDTNVKEVDTVKHKRIIAERVLDKGDEEAIAWLLNNYSVRFLKDVVRKTRNLSLRSIYFWVNYFEIDKKEVRMLDPEYLKIRKSTWPY